ncbi:MAG: glycosyltransferase family 2 protein [Candidatus Woesearchaeota archaeon]|jgi:glycosyltransferase involved in cell wall biosynthesis
MKLSIIMPVYNEAKTVSSIIDIVKKVKLGKIEKEIIAIDDGSKDGTGNVLKQIPGIKVIIHKKNRGKGAAVKNGIKAATGDIIIIQDADLEYDPNEYPKLIKPIIDKKTKVVYGSRFLDANQKKQFIFFRKKHKGAYDMAYVGGRLLTALTNILYFSKITDEPTCYKVFDSKVIKAINIKGNRFEWEPEVTAKILKKGYKIIEIPITYNPRTFEQGKKINYKDGIQAIWTLIKYRFVN